MTLSFECKKKNKNDLIAALHPQDLTLRPQIVKKSENINFYRLIKEFKKLSGVGALLNTSLNIHDKPVVFKKYDLLEILTKNHKDVNYILINNTLYKKK